MLLLRRKGSVSRLVSCIYKWFMLHLLRIESSWKTWTWWTYFWLFRHISQRLWSITVPITLAELPCCMLYSLKLALCHHYKQWWLNVLLHVRVSDVNLAPQKHSWCNPVYSACTYGQQTSTTTKYQEIIVRLNKIATATTVGVVHLLLVF